MIIFCSVGGNESSALGTHLLLLQSSQYTQYTYLHVFVWCQSKPAYETEWMKDIREADESHPHKLFWENDSHNRLLQHTTDSTHDAVTHTHNTHTPIRLMSSIHMHLWIWHAGLESIRVTYVNVSNGKLNEVCCKRVKKQVSLTLMYENEIMTHEGLFLAMVKDFP